MNILQQLLKEGILTKEKATTLEYEIRASGKKEEEVILERGILSEEKLFGLKAKLLHIPFRRALPEKIPTEVLKVIPEESVRYYKIIPLAKKDNVIEIGMVYPENLEAQEAIKFSAHQGKFVYKTSLITPTDFKNILKQYRSIRRELKKALEELKIGEKKVVTPSMEAAVFERLAEEAPIIKMVEVILRHAVEGKASDIHIEPTREKLRIRFRLDGILHSSLFLPLKVHQAVIARIKILSKLKIDETRIPQDGRFSARINDKNIDFRVSTFPTSLGEKIAIRVLDPTEGLKSLEKIGLSERNFKTIKRVIRKPYGLILSSGPTGSGKTTTLYALLRILNKEEVNIVTLEDPIEYFIEGANQSQMRPDINYNFAQGLRHVVRQDPDIIMVGEVRDQETASLVIHASLTGHIVLSTLHTSNALGVIPRLLDMGVEPYLIPPTLNIAIGQRLIRQLCPYCKKRVKAKKEIRELILKEIDGLPPMVRNEVKVPRPLYIYEPVGCKKCKMKGLIGRIGIFEILEMTESLTEVILKDPSGPNIEKEARRQGMVTMRQDGMLKVLEGITSIEEVLRATKES